MLKNHLKHFFRRLSKRPLFASINVLGLALGLASCALIGLYSYKEWTVDRFHERGERIYRVLSEVQSKASETHTMSTVGRPVPRTIEEQVPEVEKVVQLWTWRPTIKHEGNYHYEDVHFAGEDFFEVFSFPLLEGDAGVVLSEPNTAVITEGLRQKYFGENNLFRITGVAADPPPSHIDFDVLVSAKTYEAMASMEEWFTLDTYCYIQLEKSADAAAAARKIREVSMENKGAMFEEIGYRIEHPIEQVSDIYLHSGHPSGLGEIGDASRLYLLGLIALFILIIAIVNFVNLTTARVGDRSREIGIRKTVGAGRFQLIRQFLSESVGYALIGALIGILLLRAALPMFNELTGESIELGNWLQAGYLLVFFGFVLLIGLLSGLYPALLQSGLRPVDILKSEYREGGWGSWLRRGLVVVQFGIAIALIFSTLTVLRQLNFMQFQELGFEEDRVLILDVRKVPRRELVNNFGTIKEELEDLPGVEIASGAAALPGRGGWGGQVVMPEGRPKDQALNMEVIPSDHDYTGLLGLEIVAGRDFSEDMALDDEETVLLNEAAVRAIGWTPEEAVGKTLSTAGRQDAQVVGVVKDYHHHGLQSGVQPMLYFVAPYSYYYIALRLSDAQYQERIAAVKDFWKQRFPGYPFDYFFLDEDFNRQYEAEGRLSQIFGLFGFLAIFTSCMGLLGLAVYTAERRTKEIGIRKVLGATVTQIVTLLNKEFLGLVAVAALLGLPVACLLMNRWLSDFAMRVDLPWWLFAVTAGIALLVALLTVSVQSIRAASADPVHSLRDE